MLNLYILKKPYLHRITNRIQNIRTRRYNYKYNKVIPQYNLEIKKEILK